MIIKLKQWTILTSVILMISQSGLQANPAVTQLSDLKALQTKIEDVSKRVMPATVSLFSKKNGASGSGVIVSASGLILTAGHVVGDAEEMTVIFPNGKQERGKVLGANYTRDSAMIQIINQEQTWPHVAIGHSKNLKVGDLVIALGHAGGYDPVRTPPVRFGRLIAHSDNQFITSDCTLIGGDSGGPLFDLEGRVIGIHSSIGEKLSSNNHASIEGFRQDWDRLQDGKTWGRLGGSNLDDPDSPVLGVFTNATFFGGINIRAVIEGGPAAQAGIRAGDILIGINGKHITNLRTMYAQIAQHNPGDTISVQLARNQRNITRRVKLGRRSDLQR